MAEDVAPVADNTAPVDTQPSESTSDGGSWPADVQAEFTKKTQALADERKAWDRERSSGSNRKHRQLNSCSNMPNSCSNKQPSASSRGIITSNDRI